MKNTKIPQEGNETTIFNRLLRFIEPVDAEWSHRIKPASEELILELYDRLGMKDLGLELPQSFIEFSKYAGESDGGLLLNTLRGEFSISNLITRVNNRRPHPYLFVFLYDELEMEYSIDLSKEHYQKIFYDSDTEVCSSFEKLLFQCAVDLYEKEYYQYQVQFGSSIDSFSRSYLGLNQIELYQFMDRLCERYGLQKVWLSDEFYYFVYSEELSIVLDKRGGICGTIFSEKKNLIEIFEDELIKKIGAIQY
jgi:hypothetical protein